MIVNSNSKTTRRVVVLTAAITAVTLAVVTAGIVLSITPVQTAHASCVTNPKNGATACSGIGGSSSCSSGCAAIPPPGGSFSVSVTPKGDHESCSSGKGSTSDFTSSGQGCR